MIPLASPLALLGCLALSAPDQIARPSTPPQETPASGQAAAPRATDATTAAAQAALERGLTWLVAHQSTDGSFVKGEAREWAPVGVTALAGLAGMAGGNTPGRGPHSKLVAGAVDYVLAHADLDPASPRYGFISTQGDSLSRMHGHGFATLLLAEASGMSAGRGRQRPRLTRALTAAVKRIEVSQSPAGGWWYDPVASASQEGSVTICLVAAMRAARNAGIEVNGAVVRKAEDYVLKLQKPDGTFRYQLGRDQSSLALTAAAITTLNMAGRYDGNEIADGVAAIERLLLLRQDEGGRPSYPQYERLYLTQAFWQLSDLSHHTRTFARTRQKLITTQRADGSWLDTRYGDPYATAMNCLVLAIPGGLLPIFQR